MDVLSDVLTAMRTGRPHAARNRSRAPWGFRFSTAEAAGCHVVLGGTGWLIIGDGPPVPLATGDVVLVLRRGTYALVDQPETPTVDFDDPDGDPNGDEVRRDDASADTAGALTETLCAAYYLDRGRAHPLLRELPPVIHLPAASGTGTSLGQAVGLLDTELAADRHGSEVVVRALIDALLLLILREWVDRAEGAWAAALSDPAILGAVRAIHARPAESWTVESLARECASSRTTFAARFTEVVGMPPLTYLRWWRLTRAARELRTTSATIGQVARRAGYTSEFAFTKAFRREFDTSPRDYRRAALR